MQDGDVIGTKAPTGHSILINCHFEQPFGKIKSSGGGGAARWPFVSAFQFIILDRQACRPRELPSSFRYS